MITDNVFHDDMAVGKSMAIVTTGGALLCLAVMTWAARLRKSDAPLA
jgi:hypothetical protein